MNELPVSTQPTQTPPSVAVLGAGISGLVCARTLHDRGYSVVVFDKSRGTGGRISTRRTDGSLQFDHGAQYFTARGEAMRRKLDDWVRDEVVAEWSPRVAVLDADGARIKDETTTRYVGRPTMSALTRHLARDLTVHYRSRVTGLQREPAGSWRLRFEDDAAGLDAPFDTVVSTLPAPQAAELFADVAPAQAARIARVEFAPTWAMMVDFDGPLDVAFDAAFINQGPLSWMAREGSKPGRSEHNSWVLHATPEWSRANLEVSRTRAQAELLAALERVLRRWTSARRPPTRYASTHRWRYAQAMPALDEEILVDADRGLIFAGDWVNGSRVEGAFESGLQAANWIMSR